MGQIQNFNFSANRLGQYEIKNENALGLYVADGLSDFAKKRKEDEIYNLAKNARLADVRAKQQYADDSSADFNKLYNSNKKFKNKIDTLASTDAGGEAFAKVYDSWADNNQLDVESKLKSIMANNPNSTWATNEYLKAKDAKTIFEATAKSSIDKLKMARISAAMPTVSNGINKYTGAISKNKSAGYSIKNSPEFKKAAVVDGSKVNKLTEKAMKNGFSEAAIKVALLNGSVDESEGMFTDNPAFFSSDKFNKSLKGFSPNKKKYISRQDVLADYNNKEIALFNARDKIALGQIKDAEQSMRDAKRGYTDAELKRFMDIKIPNKTIVDPTTDPEKIKLIKRNVKKEVKTNLEKDIDKNNVKSSSKNIVKKLSKKVKAKNWKEVFLSPSDRDKVLRLKKLSKKVKAKNWKEVFLSSSDRDKVLRLKKLKAENPDVIIWDTKTGDVNIDNAIGEPITETGTKQQLKFMDSYIKQNNIENTLISKSVKQNILDYKEKFAPVAKQLKSKISYRDRLSNSLDILKSNKNIDQNNPAMVNLKKELAIANKSIDKIKADTTTMSSYNKDMAKLELDKIKAYKSGNGNAAVKIMRDIALLKKVGSKYTVPSGSREFNTDIAEAIGQAKRRSKYAAQDESIAQVASIGAIAKGAYSSAKNILDSSALRKKLFNKVTKNRNNRSMSVSKNKFANPSGNISKVSRGDLSRKIIKNDIKAIKRVNTKVNDIDPSVIAGVGYAVQPKNQGPTDENINTIKADQNTPSKEIANIKNVRNVNPGNLRPPANVTYDGQTSLDNDGFAIFEEPKYGVRALALDMKNKIGRGLDSIAKIIEVYAPVADNNDTASYIKGVSESLGIGPDAKLSESDIAGLVKAIIKQEGGSKVLSYYTDDVILEGMSLLPK